MTENAKIQHLIYTEQLRVKGGKIAVPSELRLNNCGSKTVKTLMLLGFLIVGQLPARCAC